MSKLRYKQFLTILMVFGILAVSLVNGYLRVYAASAYSPKVLIVSNNDIHNSSSVSGGTSAAQMRTTLEAAGYSVTVWDEVAQGAPTLANTNALSYDVVIFTQGVGYRSPNNGKEGLNAADIAFLRDYQNSKGHLIVEGEDVLYDISLTGTSTDQKEILKINTSSSRSDRGKISVLKVTDSAHAVNQGLAASVGTAYQTNWQDSLVADTGAKVIMNGTFGSTDYGAINTWDGGNGKRLVFMPFAWYVNASNGISDAGWRNTLLLNAVKWVGEKQLAVSGTNLVASTTPPNTNGILMEKFTFSASNGDVYLNGLTIEEHGTATASSHIPQIKIYEDTNNNSIVDGGEPLLGSGSFGAGLETRTFTFAAPVKITPGTPRNFLVMYDIGSIANDTTVGARLTGASAVVIHPDDLLSVVTGSFPVSSNLTKIFSAGTAEIRSPLNNDVVRGVVSIAGTASSGYTLEYGLGTSPSSWTTILTSGAGVTNGTLSTWDTTVKDAGLNPITPDGWYTLRLRVITGAQTSIFVDVDNSSPIIELGPSAINITNREATITWKTNELSTSKVEYKKSADSTYSAVNSTALVNDHSIQISDLTGGTGYDVRVTSVDAVGNSTTSSVINFATLKDGAIGQITVPAQGGTAGGVFDVLGTAITTNPTPGAYVQWNLDYGQGTNPEAISSWVPLVANSNSPVNNGPLFNWNTTGLSGGYTLRLVVTDPTLTGSTATTTQYASFTLDNTNPVISNIQVNNITNTSATVSWGTDKPTTGQVSYRIDGSTYGPPVGDSDGDKQVFLPELQPNTLYYYQITVTDNYGHTAVSSEKSFTTTNVNDTTPPTAPVWISATGRTDTTVDLAWKAGTDNTGIAGYQLYRSTDGSSFVHITTVPGNKFSYTDTGLNASTVYYYKLTSLDLAGNESALADSGVITVPTVGAARINPHGAYPKLTDMCGKCHITHRALKTNLFRDTQEQKVCFTCHNGTGSQYNVQMEYDPSHTSHHPLPMAHTGKECASCHNPHLSAADSPRLLAPKKLDGTSESKGPQVCLVCHGTEVVSKVASEIGGSHEGFLTSSHYTSLKMPNPPSGSQIKCVDCHKNHSSEYARLTKAKEEQDCFQCHSARQGAPANMTNIEGLFSLTSRHKVSDADQADGSKVECVNCHNPHYVTSTNRLSDPDNTNIKWTGNTTAFCLKCHDSGPFPLKQVDSTTVVPHSVSFPSVNFTTNPGGWNKTGYLNSGHYSRNYQCTECHDPHGSTNTWLTKSFEEVNCTKCHDGSTTGADNINALLGKTYKHPVNDPAKNGAHSNTENYASIATRHAECVDCHNPHEANRTAPTVRNGTNEGPLKGVSGVGVNWSNVPAGATPAAGDFIIKPGADLQAEVCLKCHSNYAYGSSPPAGQTNQAMEFNPANSSVHPVFGSGNNPYTTSTATNGNKVTMEPPFNQNANEHTPLKCTDCHGVDTTAATFNADTNLKGPHGSNNQYMLKRPYNSDAFCLLCHKTSIYESGGAGSRFNRHNSHSGQSCRTCHGGTAANRKGMIHGTNARYQDIVSGSSTPNTRIQHFLSGDAFTGWQDGTPGNARCYTTQHNNTY